MWKNPFLKSWLSLYPHKKHIHIRKIAMQHIAIKHQLKYDYHATTIVVIISISAFIRNAQTNRSRQTHIKAINTSLTNWNRLPEIEVYSCTSTSKHQNRIMMTVIAVPGVVPVIAKFYHIYIIIKKTRGQIQDGLPIITGTWISVQTCSNLN